ncbi:MAG: hypothetical protein AMJ79_07610 [Phycisphaerae bacterium SM23_30]|nr:MAG: hypothetical protein AMJ79_07610 [Phycisphaerae bacterium SM23_30]
MTTNISYYINLRARDATFEKFDVKNFSQECSEIARGFLRKFPEYQPTPLYSLKDLAKKLGVRDILVKDESYRFGLKAFKVTGSSFALGKFISEKLGINIRDVSPSQNLLSTIRSRLGLLTFTTGTSGNHGTGLAWAAQKFGQRAVIYVPKGAAAGRKAKLEQLGAEVRQTEENYDDTIDLVKKIAPQTGFQIIADTGWEGYEIIPVWIMQGYTAIFNEVRDQLTEQGFDPPTHIFIQGGVGSFSGSAVGYYTNQLGQDRPKIAVVEPAPAACLQESARHADGRARRIKSDLNTMMAGLACAQPNPVAWPVLRDYADFFISCADVFAETGMRTFAYPIGDDPKIVSGASGAVGLGLLLMLLENDDYADLKLRLGLNKNSRILLFNTEGDTDPEHYHHIIQK